jgi:uncharacterized membrane protein YedE/YeeE
MKQNVIALLCGKIFVIGLSLLHMINPNKVLNFPDITGNWDSSLIFIMIGAVALVSFKWLLKCLAPIVAETFYISRKSSVDKLLLLDATIFGIGWSMSGYCPGPSVTGLGLLSL